MPMSSAQAMLILPTRVEDFGDETRFTPDGRISVYDGISVVLRISEAIDVGINWKSLPKKKFDDLARQQWKRLRIGGLEVVTTCHNFQFSGQGQRETPVADLITFLEFLVLLPGELSGKLRREAVATLVRAMNGDVTLVEEILQRINNLEDLQRVEVAARERCTDEPENLDRAEFVEEPQSREFRVDNGFPLGSEQNPLTKITTEIRQGNGWVGKEEKLEELLSSLAAYRGMFIHRQVPHRPWSQTAKSAKSRRIDLILCSTKDSNVLRAYHFEPDYVDEADVANVCLGRSYPEILFRDRNESYKHFEFYIVSPCGITDAGVKRLKEVQPIIDSNCDGRVKLGAMRLDKLVWDEMYPAIEDHHKDSNGRFGYNHLNGKIRKLCELLCDRPDAMSQVQSPPPEPVQEQPATKGSKKSKSSKVSVGQMAFEFSY